MDRLDYTKGILERFWAIEKFLDDHLNAIEDFAFVQIAAPSRSIIQDYQDFEKRVRKEADRINAKFARNNWKPLILKVEHHEPFELFTFYRAADVCIVSSLHDGMNLVAKEFLSAHDDEQGVLIPSQFTGAARDLPESLIVNPYDTDQFSFAIEKALNMSSSEQRVRMRSMRALIPEFNVYRWAGRMFIDAARMRQRNRVRERFQTSLSLVKGVANS